MVTRTLTALHGNSQRLDGGAMFGNAPRPVWSQWIAPDERNRIPLAFRAMPVRETHAEGPVPTILFETWIGALIVPKLRWRFAVG